MRVVTYICDFCKNTETITYTPPMIEIEPSDWILLSGTSTLHGYRFCSHFCAAQWFLDRCKE